MTAFHFAVVTNFFLRSGKIFKAFVDSFQTVIHSGVSGLGAPGLYVVYECLGLRGFTDYLASLPFNSPAAKRSRIYGCRYGQPGHCS